MPHGAAPGLVDLPADRKLGDDAVPSSSPLKPAHEPAPMSTGRAALTFPGGAVNWEAYLSDEGRERTVPSLREIVTRCAGAPGVIGLHAGLPPAAAFPIASMSYTLQDGTAVHIDDPGKLAAMQQYSIAPLGYPPLQQWTAAHVARRHTPPAPTATCITTGSNASLEMLCSLLLNSGDALITEQYTYSHIIESTINLKNYRAVPVAMDAVGVDPAALAATLEREHSAAAAGGPPPPRVMYTVPTGQNPTGSTVPIARKAEIYEICRRYDVVILEDDPYWYLQFPDASGEPKGLDALERSYLSLDTDGRVVRLDSFAKFLAPGLRLGWATGAPAIIQKLVFCITGTSLGACATTQVIVAEMLEAWGDAGLTAHISNCQQSYARRAAVICAAAEKHLAGLASWRAPQAGMFLWLALGAGVADADEILNLLAEQRVCVVPGRICHALGPRPPQPCPFVRISFSTVEDAELEESMARLATVLRRFAALRPAAAATGEPMPLGATAAAASGA